MKKPKLKLLTLLIGIIVAISAVTFGIGMAKSHKMAQVNPTNELPTINPIDLNKVFFLLFSK